MQFTKRKCFHEDKILLSGISIQSCKQIKSFVLKWFLQNNIVVIILENYFKNIKFFEIKNVYSKITVEIILIHKMLTDLGISQ